MKMKIFGLSVMTIMLITMTSFQNLKTPRAAGTSNLIVPFSQSLFTNGEIVSFAGDIHLLTIFFPNDPLRVQSNVMNVTGTGLTSGLTYKIIGTDNSVEAASPGSQFQTTHIYRILPPNPIFPNDPVHMQYTIDLDSDGSVTEATAIASTILEGTQAAAKN